MRESKAEEKRNLLALEKLFLWEGGFRSTKTGIFGDKLACLIIKGKCHLKKRQGDIKSVQNKVLEIMDKSTTVLRKGGGLFV